MKVLAFGELLWDIIDGVEHIGGAPFNMAAHLSKMGAEAGMVSAVGRDKRGTRALEEVRRLGIRTDLIAETAQFPTGIVNVEVDAHGKPTYEIREGSAWDRIELDAGQMKTVSEETWDIAAFGTLAQRTSYNREVLKKVLEGAAPKEVFFDVNLRLEYYNAGILEDSLNAATILKLNDEEVPVISKLVFGREIPDEDFCRTIEKERGIPTTVLTRGKQGALVYHRGTIIHVPIIDVPVADTVGAGDSFSAGFLYGYFQTGDAGKGARLAAELSSFVASRSGAIPSYNEHIEGVVRNIRM